MNTYEKTPGGWGHSSHPGTTSNQANLRLLCEPPYAQRLRVILFCLRLPTVNFQLWTVDFLFPCATLSAPLRGGAPDADTRGCLETAVRVHGFREFAQTHAGSGSVCARLCAQDRGGRRDLGAGRTAARFRLRALAQSGAFAGSGASFGRSKDFARAGVVRGARARDSFARGLLQFPAPDSAGADALRLRRDRRLLDGLRVRAPVKKYFGSGSGFGKAPHEGQTLRQGRLARGRAQRRRRTWRPAGRAHRLLHRGTAGTRRRAGPARLAVSLPRRLAEVGDNQRWAYNTSAAPNTMPASTPVTTLAANHRARMAVRKNEALPFACSATAVTGESSTVRGAWGIGGRAAYATLATKL